jgi:DNA adenine methylase
VLTNAAHNTVAEIFDVGDSPMELARVSLVGGKSARRGSITEYVFSNIEMEFDGHPE